MSKRRLPLVTQFKTRAIIWNQRLRVKYFLFYRCCLLRRRRPPLCGASAAGPACPPGLRSSLEGDEAEGHNAVWCCGGLCHLGLRDCPRAAHGETPEQAGTGAQGTGEFTGGDKLDLLYFLFILVELRSREFPFIPSFKLILELCRKQPDEKVVMTHLERIRAPASLSSSSDYSKVNQI